ncbi:MAG: hypothetical protein FWD66_10925, partial [Paludibacter sp.]|nr:hypothetical protein [Paludibacter sp.]
METKDYSKEVNECAEYLANSAFATEDYMGDLCNLCDTIKTIMDGAIEKMEKLNIKFSSIYENIYQAITISDVIKEKINCDGYV